MSDHLLKPAGSKPRRIKVGAVGFLTHQYLGCGMYFFVKLSIWSVFVWLAFMAIASVIAALIPDRSYPATPLWHRRVRHDPMAEIVIYNKGSFVSGHHSPFTLADEKIQLPELNLSEGKIIPVTHEYLNASGVTEDQLATCAVGYVVMKKPSCDYHEGQQVMLVDKAKLESLFNRA